MTCHSKNIMAILCNSHCADSIRKLVHKLGRLASRIDLPDLWLVDQRHEDLAVGSNSNVLNPLWWSVVAFNVRREYFTTHSLVREVIHRLHKSICIAYMQWRGKAKADKIGDQADQESIQCHRRCKRLRLVGPDNQPLLCTRQPFLMLKYR
jgi:hypothetical protein